jgi:hypothetical protein
MTDSSQPARRKLLLVNGGFLVLVGAVQVFFELTGYYTGRGIYGAIFEGSPYTIGWVENHGLALLIGLLFLTVAARDAGRPWHVFAVVLHAFLGTANVVFWDAFVTFGTTTTGLVATIGHVLFVGAHSVALVVSRRPATVRTESAGTMASR